MTFTGFPEQAIRFYEGLELDNSKAYWLAHKAAYDGAVKEPMQALMEELAPEFGTAKLFRPNRDIRFSTDKSPYKTNQGAFVGTSTGVGYYVEISTRGLLAGGGFRAHSTAQTTRLRQAIDADDSGTELERIVTVLRRAGLEVVGDQVATAPRGYARDHPRIELLRLKELMVLKRFGEPAWVGTRRARAQVEKVWRGLGPLGDWIAANIGPA